MTHRPTNTRIVTVLIAAAALTGALAPGAATADEQIYVNPSTGYPSSLPAEDEKIYVNPSTGFASGASESSADPTGASYAPQATLAQGSSAGGFDWPSAAIGAAAGTAVLLMVLAATTGVAGRGRGPLARRRAVRT